MPKIIPFLADTGRSQRVMKAMLQIDKINVGGLKRAHACE